jgi:hypothetical protein
MKTAFVERSAGERVTNRKSGLMPIVGKRPAKDACGE